MSLLTRINVSYALKKRTIFESLRRVTDVMQAHWLSGRDLMGAIPCNPVRHPEWSTRIIVAVSVAQWVCCPSETAYASP